MISQANVGKRKVNWGDLMTATVLVRHGAGDLTKERGVDDSIGVVVRPAPAADPPYDEALGVTQPPDGMEMLPVAWTGDDDTAQVLPPNVPASPRPPGRSPVSATVMQARRNGQAEGRPRRLITGQHAARRYVDLCVEVLNGYRPAAQLRPFTEPRRFSAVADQLIKRTTRVRMGTVAPRRKHRPVLVKRMVVGEPIEGVAEAAAVLGHGDLVWAMAVRMERQGDGWLCTFAGVL
jgi:hypothetical protein